MLISTLRKRTQKNTGYGIRSKQFRRRLAQTIFPLLLLLTLSGCVTLADPESGQPGREQVVGVVQPGSVLEQTFVSRRAGLNGVQIWLAPTQAGEVSGVVAFDLYRLGESEPLAATAYSAASLAAAGTLVLPVPAHTAPAGQSYSLRIRSDSTPFSIFGSLAAAGDMRLNGIPKPGAASLGITYTYTGGAAWADLLDMLRSAWLILPFGLALWLPGRALLALLGRDQAWDWGERTALSLGLSLAALPVLMTWTSLVGWRWSRAAILSGGALLATWLVLTWAAARRSDPRPSPASFSLSSLLAGAALGAVFLAALFVRLAMVRDLAAPAWVDSVHHALLTRLILEGGAFPHDYTPFLPSGVNSYHSGFHTGAAVFIWASGLDLAQGLLLYGQALNALAVFPAYLFTRLYTRRPAAGIIAALIVGFITPMPAYYSSWGRYTQLAGLLILPAALVLLYNLLVVKAGGTRLDEKSRWSPPHLLLAAVASGGLFLTHYRIAAFLALLLLAELASRGMTWLLGRAWKWLQTRQSALSEPAQTCVPEPEPEAIPVPVLPDEQLALLRGPVEAQPVSLLAWAAAAGFAVLLTLPWWPGALNEMVGPKLHWETGAARLFSDFSPVYLTAGLGRYSLGLAAAGGLWALLLRRRFVLTLAVWVGLLFLVANLGVLGLPGGSYINNTAVAISLFLPIALLGGFGAGWLGEALSSLLGFWLGRFGRAAPWLLYTAAGIAAMVFGARALLPLLNPGTLLFRSADRPALTWIENNLPAGSTVLINSFSWGYGMYAGQDGGYWIGPLTGRPTFPPPVLYGMDNDLARIRETSAAAQQFLEASPDPAALYARMIDHGIEYVYVGARGGKLDPLALDGSPLFERLYHVGPAWVFHAIP